MSDLVERLRTLYRTYRQHYSIAEAADEIERLRAAAQSAPGHVDMRPPHPDFRVAPVRVLQSAYDRIDAMLSDIEPDLRAANSVRIELRHLINETYALSSTQRNEDQS